MSEHTSEFVQSILDSVDDAPCVSWLADRRASGRKALEGLEPPTRRDEDWRFTEVKRLTKQTFVRPTAATLSSTALDSMNLPECEGARLVFVNGAFQASLSDTSALPDSVFAGSAADLEGEQLGAVQDAIGQTVDYYQDAFAALADAAANDVAAIVVPRNTAVETTIHLLHVSLPGDEAWAAAPRTVVVAGQGAKVGLVEEFRGPEGGVYFNNAVTEVVLRDNAHVDHVRVQRESDDAFHLGRHAIRLGSHSHYDSVSVHLGAQHSRTDIYALHDGEGTWCRVDGVALVRGNQLNDMHSVLDNTRPHCESHQLHKCIADDKAHAVFNGKIFVREGAQKVDAYQLNRNLLLSNTARVDTKPQLEIFADDVKCTHGATIGQLEEEQLFYLISRGFDPKQARGLLTYAFAAEVIEHINVESLKTDLEELAASRVAI